MALEFFEFFILYITKVNEPARIQRPKKVPQISHITSKRRVESVIFGPGELKSLGESARSFYKT
jgi:hypothetical protein